MRICVGRFSYLFYIVFKFYLYAWLLFSSSSRSCSWCWLLVLGFRCVYSVFSIQYEKWSKFIVVAAACLRRTVALKPLGATENWNKNAFHRNFFLICCLFFDNTWAERNMTQPHAHKIFLRYFNAFGGIACASEEYFSFPFLIKWLLRSENIVTNIFFSRYAVDRWQEDDANGNDKV